LAKSSIRRALRASIAKRLSIPSGQRDAHDLANVTAMRVQDRVPLAAYQLEDFEAHQIEVVAPERVKPADHELDAGAFLVYLSPTGNTRKLWTLTSGRSLSATRGFLPGLAGTAAAFCALPHTVGGFPARA
jgi:hypothetical protein